MSTIEEAREQARAAQEQIINRLICSRLGLSSTREMDKDMLALSNGLDALSALLDATEPPAQRTCGPCSRGQHGVCDGPNEFWGDCSCIHADKPAEDEREALIEEARVAYVTSWEREDAYLTLNGHSKSGHMRSRSGIVAALAVFEKWPRPITDEMVEAATFDWLCTRGIYTSLDQVPKQIVANERDRMRAALEAAEEARR